MPSLWGGMPIALFEVMEMSLPVVVSDLNEISAFVEYEQPRLLVEPKNVIVLSEEISCILSDEDLRRKLAKAGQTSIREKYTKDQICWQSEGLFHRESEIELT